MSDLKSVAEETKRIVNLSASLNKGILGVSELDPNEADKLDAIMGTVRQSLGEAIKIVGKAATIDMQ